MTGRPLDSCRLLVAGAALAAVAYQYGDRHDGPGFSPGNFFSFFTIQSNLLAIVTLGALAIVPRAGRSRLFEVLRGAVVLYMLITGVVFALLLSGLQESLQTPTAWVDFVLHKLTPVALVADWLIDPPRRRIGSATALAWLAFPAAWLVYTLVRGAAVGWYPYPFVDVGSHGYDGVAVNCVFLLAGMVAAAWLVAWVGRRRGGAALT